MVARVRVVAEAQPVLVALQEQPVHEVPSGRQGVRDQQAARVHQGVKVRRVRVAAMAPRVLKVPRVLVVEVTHPVAGEAVRLLVDLARRVIRTVNVCGCLKYSRSGA